MYVLFKHIQMKKKNIFIITIIFYFSCSQNPPEFNSELSFDIFEKIEHQILKIDTTIICGFVADMEIIDSFLVVNDFLMKDNAINLYNYRTGEVVHRLGFVGNGPGELIYPSMNIFTSANKIQLYEPNLRKLIEYNLNYDDRQRCSEYSMLKTNINGFIREVVKVNDHFICMGGGGKFDDNRFIVLDTFINIKYSTGEYPLLVERQSISDVQDILYYVRHLALRPDGARLAFGSYIGAVLEIFDVSEIEKDINKINTVKIFPPIFDRNKNVTWNDNTIIGFEDLYATNNFIYALLNGTLGAQYQYPNSICVFDWNGTPIKKFITDVPLRSIAVDEVSKKIFAVTHPNEEDPKFVYFDIK